MMQAEAKGRLGDVSKLLQAQRRDFVQEGLPAFFRGAHEVGGPREIFEISRVAIAVEKLPPPPSEKKCDATSQ